MVTRSDIITGLLRYELWHDKSAIDLNVLNTLTVDDWLDIHTLSLRQNVSAVIFDAITDIGVTLPRPIKMRFISDVDDVENKYAAKLKAATQLVKLFESHGIRMMILKGIGLSLLYPKPNHRPCSDIDIYLFGHQHEADEILRKAHNINIDIDKHHHTVFYINKTMVENHYDFIETHSRRSLKYVEKQLKEFAATEEPLKVQIGDCEAYIPSPNLNALFMLKHSGGHFAASGISIRHLIDWSLFVNRFGNDVNWERIYAIADKFGFRTYTDCLNAICSRNLGLKLNPQMTVSHDEELVTRCWNDILESGKEGIPKNFIKGWYYRINRRLANSWKERIMYHDNPVESFILSGIMHIVKPKYWKKDI